MLTEIRSIAILGLAVTFSACASPGQPDEADLCPPGLTVYCETHVNKQQRCFCASREQLERVLEPPVKDY